MEKIGFECFSNSGLEELQTPPNLREIGDRAFCDCRNLKTVRLNGRLELFGISAFKRSGVEKVTFATELA